MRVRRFYPEVSDTQPPVVYTCQHRKMPPKKASVDDGPWLGNFIVFVKIEDFINITKKNPKQRQTFNHRTFCCIMNDGYSKIKKLIFLFKLAVVGRPRLEKVQITWTFGALGLEKIFVLSKVRDPFAPF